MLAGQGRRAVAIEHYEAALAAFPEDADLHNDLGVALDAVRRTDDAREHYHAAVRARPAFHRPHINLANQALAMGNQTEALAALEEAQRVGPEMAETNARLARFLATCPDERLRDGERAVVLAERAAELTQGQHSRVLDTLGTAYAAAGHFSDATAVAQRARERALFERNEALASDIEARLAGYATGKAYIEPLHEPLHEPQ